MKGAKLSVSAPTSAKLLQRPLQRAVGLYLQQIQWSASLHPSFSAFHARDLVSVVANSTQEDTNPSLVCRKFSCSNSIVNLSQRVSNSNHGCYFKERRLPLWKASSFYSWTKVNYYISCMLYICIYIFMSYYKYTCIVDTLFHICHTKYFFGR